MIRRLLGALLAIVGAAAAIWGLYRPWYDGRHGSTYRLGDVFSNITGHGASWWESLLVPMIVAGVIVLAAVLLGSRFGYFLAGAVVLGFTILWMVQQGRAIGSLSIDSHGHGLGEGVGAAVGGGVLMWLAAVVTSGRSLSRPSRRKADAGGPAPYESGETADLPGQDRQAA